MTKEVSNPRDQYDPGDLKKALVDFSQSERFDREIRRALRESGLEVDGVVVADEHEMINFWDHFILERVTRKGYTPLELFVREQQRRKALPEEICQQLLRWKEPVSSVFEVRERIAEDILLLHNLVNRKECVTRATLPGGMAGIQVGFYLITRIVPWYDHYCFSGATQGYPPEAKERMLEVMAEFKREHPAALFVDDEERRTKALVIQKRMYDAFVAYFGDDEVVFSTGQEMGREMSRFYHFYTFEYVHPDWGKTLAEKSREEGEEPGDVPPHEYPKDLLEAEQVGVLFDPEQGMFILSRYGYFRRLFLEEDFTRVPDYENLFYKYLEEQSIPPLPFHRAVERYPEQARKVFAAILGQRKFNLERSFPKLMRRYKGHWLDRKPEPTVIPLNEERGS
jgi:hypothetical protein